MLVVGVDLRILDGAMSRHEHAWLMLMLGAGQGGEFNLQLGGEFELQLGDALRLKLGRSNVNSWVGVVGQLISAIVIRPRFCI